MGVTQKLQDGFHSVRDKPILTAKLVVHPNLDALQDLPGILGGSAGPDRFSVDNGEFLVGGISSQAYIRGIHFLGVTHPAFTVPALTRLTTEVSLTDLRQADLVLPWPTFGGSLWPIGVVFEGTHWMADDVIGFRYQNTTAGDLEVPQKTWLLLVVNLSAKV